MVFENTEHTILVFSEKVFLFSEFMACLVPVYENCSKEQFLKTQRTLFWYSLKTIFVL